MDTAVGGKTRGAVRVAASLGIC